MSKKGISFEEKKARMLQLLYQKKEFFQLKELEKLGPKEKGVIANSVKEVIQSLVDDGVVDTEKISGSVYFWAFPSKSVNVKKRKLDDLEKQFESSNKKLKLVNANLKDLECQKENIDFITNTMSEIVELEAKKLSLEKEIKETCKHNPQNVAEMKKETQPVKEAANRWTDNIFAIKSWCKKKFFMEEQVLNKQFSIPEDLDYLI